MVAVCIVAVVLSHTRDLQAQEKLQLGESGYGIIPTTGQISEDAGRDILRRLRHSYKKNVLDHNEQRFASDVWKKLHNAFSGDIYDEIMLVTLRIRLNRLLSILRAPVSAAPVIPGKTPSLVYLSRRKISTNWGGEYWECEAPGFVYFNVRSEPRGVFLEGRAISEKFRNYSESQEKIAQERAIADLEADFEKELDGHLKTAGGLLSSDVEDDLRYFSNRVSHDGFVYTEQWDPLMIKMVELVASDEAVRKPARDSFLEKLIPPCVNLSVNEETRDTLVGIGRQLGLPIQIDGGESTNTGPRL